MQDGTGRRGRTSGQGQSAATIDKERCIGAALSVGMRINAKKFPGFPYWHFDANAGSGWNEKVDVPGTPLVFWALARQYLQDMNVHAYFSEIDDGRASELCRRLKDDDLAAGRSYVMPGSNADGIKTFAALIRKNERNPQFAAGSLIVDPNGWFYGDSVPIAELVEFCRDFPRIDIVLNLNARSYRLQKGHPDKFLQLGPRSIFRVLRKQHWLVRRTHAGGCEFLLAIGRNVKTGDHKGLHMHDLHSEAGEHIIRLIEGKRQPPLDFAS